MNKCVRSNDKDVIRFSVELRINNKKNKGDRPYLKVFYSCTELSKRESSETNFKWSCSGKTY